MKSVCVNASGHEYTEPQYLGIYTFFLSFLSCRLWYPPSLDAFLLEKAIP